MPDQLAIATQRLLIAFDWNYSAVARLAHVSPDAIINAENGEQLVTAKTKIKIFKALQLLEEIEIEKNRDRWAVQEAIELTARIMYLQHLTVHSEKRLNRLQKRLEGIGMPNIDSYIEQSILENN